MTYDDGNHDALPDPETTLEELERTGQRRAAKRDQVPLPTLVEEFLKLAIERPANYETMSRQKQAELDRERVGFCKAQEKLREFIAVVGGAGFVDLADVRDDRQIRPHLMGTMRLWGVTD